MVQVHGLWELPGALALSWPGPWSRSWPRQLPQAMDLDHGFGLVSDYCWISVGLVWISVGFVSG